MRAYTNRDESFVQYLPTALLVGLAQSTLVLNYGLIACSVAPARSGQQPATAPVKLRLLVAVWQQLPDFLVTFFSRPIPPRTPRDGKEEGDWR